MKSSRFDFRFKVHGPKSSVALLSLVPDFHLHEQKIEAIFLVDCSGSLTVFCSARSLNWFSSGSMNGPSIQLAKEALQVSVM